MINKLKEGYVSVETHRGVTSIEFFHSQNNSLPGKLLDELAKEIHFAGSDDDETKVIVLKSAGDKIFCSGISFDELTDLKSETEGFKFFMGYANLINAMRKCPKFIIGRIQGRCIGAGVGLAAAVDYAIATDKAEVKLSELSLGIGPFVVGPAIERKIGTSSFSTLAINTSIWRTADWARKKGLYAEVHINEENMDEAIRILANNLAHCSPRAMSEMKKVFWKGTEHWDELLKERASINGKLAVNEFTKQALEKFLVR